VPSQLGEFQPSVAARDVRLQVGVYCGTCQAAGSDYDHQSVKIATRRGAGFLDLGGPILEEIWGGWQKSPSEVETKPLRSRKNIANTRSKFCMSYVVSKRAYTVVLHKSVYEM